ncbi:MAG: cytochrome c biogenesis protein [candidate division WOR-3 bacterium]|nr:cytochrome c biogenesis protein [candidate division WOR-3 bacterium]MCX7947551.1 cytochrome c biogenesis protein [candidate division WOR-3 bacterium]MDW8150437.1 cytochrome c biogenesis protein CcsA [candidate division WOR-3 bacterium]
MSLLFFIVFLLVSINLFLIFIWAPPVSWPGEKGIVLGHIQKIFYYHVSSAWIMMISLFIGLIFSILYLRNKKLDYDILASVSIKLGILFGMASLVMGSIWAKPAWGVFWTWDPRLTTMAITILYYFGYIALRNMLSDDIETRAKTSSFIAIIGFINVPITFISIRIWRSIHPIVIEGTNEKFNMSPEITFVMIFSLITLLSLYALMFYLTYRVEKFEIKRILKI